MAEGLAFPCHRGAIRGFGQRSVSTGEMPKEMGKALYRALEKRQLEITSTPHITAEEDAEEILAASAPSWHAQQQDWPDGREGGDDNWRPQPGSSYVSSHVRSGAVQSRAWGVERFPRTCGCPPSTRLSRSLWSRVGIVVRQPRTSVLLARGGS